MTNEERSSNAQMTKLIVKVLCHSDFVIISGFVIRHLPVLLTAKAFGVD
jgi:hypothetical protein